VTLRECSSAGLVGVVLAAAAAGCGGAERFLEGVAAVPSRTKAEVRTEAPPRRCAVGAFHRFGSRRVAYAAVVRRPTTAYRRVGGAPIASFGRLNVNGVPTVFGVLGAVRDRRCRATWYRVQLPIRPNGSTGWVRARNAALAKVRTRIEIDLSDRRVTLFRHGRRAIETVAAVGSSATPTPVGRFYVNQRLIPSNEAGPFGPGAVGISAFSPALTGWAQGGPIAIHGTNQPSLIGQRVSNGCVRVRNDVLRRIFAASLAGTPVLIRR
jgi:lipoprotein-anchoring transpeptidase ErfK/SrfK